MCLVAATADLLQVLLVRRDVDVAAGSTMTGLSETKQVTGSAPYDVYAMATATEGTHGNAYKLCWGHNPSNNEDWKFEIGVFTLKGPAEAARVD